MQTCPRGQDADCKSVICRFESCRLLHFTFNKKCSIISSVSQLVLQIFIASPSKPLRRSREHGQEKGIRWKSEFARVALGSFMGQTLALCTVRLSARTLPFHGRKRGSIPLRCTILKYIEHDMRTPNHDGCYTLCEADKRIATEVKCETVYFNMVRRYRMSAIPSESESDTINGVTIKSLPSMTWCWLLYLRIEV